MKKNTALCFILFLFCGLLARPLHASADPDSLNMHEIKKFNYKIGTPAGWTENFDAEKGNKSFASVSESESSEDSFMENMNVTTYKNIDDNLKSYYKDYFNRTKFSAPGFKKVQEGEETINNEKAKFFIYTCDYNGIKLKIMAWVLIKNKTAYIIQEIALDGTFDQYKAAFQSIARSIVLMDPPKPEPKGKKK